MPHGDRFESLDPAALVDVKRGLASRRIFVDEQVYRMEMERIFTRTWVLIGHESEVPAAGDYVTRTIGDDPVILIRGDDDVLRVFLNSCPHRGTMLCMADAGNAPAITCPYHGWAFDSSGHFRGAPIPSVFYKKEMPAEELGLEPMAQVDTWAGLVFGCFDAEAAPLLDYLGDARWYLELAFGRTPGGMEVLGPPQRFVMEQNWKIGALNFGGDGPHGPLLHGTAGQLTTGSAGAELMEALMHSFAPGFSLGNGHAGLLTLAPEDAAPWLGFDPALLPLYKETLSSDQFDVLGRMMAYVFTVFPHMSVVQIPVGFNPDREPVSMCVLRTWQPVGPEKTEVWNWFMVDSEASPELKAETLKACTRTFSVAGTFDQDDVEAWSGIRRGVRGTMSRRLPLRFQTINSTTEPLLTDFPGPGRAFRDSFTEIGEFDYLIEWRRYMDQA